MNILITDEFSTPALVRLQKIAGVHIEQDKHYPDLEKLKKAHVLLIRSRTKVDADFLAKSQELKLIVSSTSGTDHIDLAACAARGVRVASTPDAQTDAAAELTLYLILATLRRATQVQQAMRSYHWKDAIPKGLELKGRTVGIVGLGRVGGRVAELVQAFGAHVVAHDPYQTDEVFEKLGVARLGFTEVLVQAQILSLHVPLTAETRRFLNAQTLATLSEDAIVINTSRGQVVDEGDLLRALESGQLLAAGLDVFEHEPLGQETRLRKLKNAVLTPHIGAYTEEAFDRASEQAAQVVIDWSKSPY